LIDIGTNIGLYSLCAAMKVPGGRVVACEPAAPNLTALHETLALNRLTQVTSCAMACDRAFDLKWLYIAVRNGGIDTIARRIRCPRVRRVGLAT
jgi:FkbM family methyltransferase